MQSTELSAVLIALGVVLALAVLVTLVWRRMGPPSEW